MIALGAGSPTRAICSTLIAQAFHSIRYPILPQIEIVEDNLAKLQSEYARAEIFHIRSHTLFTPHDFDISPYFAVIKPMIEAGFDHRTLTWAEESTLDRTSHRSSSSLEPAGTRRDFPAADPNARSEKPFAGRPGPAGDSNLAGRDGLASPAKET